MSQMYTFLVSPTFQRNYKCLHFTPNIRSFLRCTTGAPKRVLKTSTDTDHAELRTGEIVKPVTSPSLGTKFFVDC